jgi:PPK2 family polyphosphate:nucleotide phosphotransferase
MNYRKEFQVRPGDKFKLADLDAGFTDSKTSHKTAAKEVKEFQKRLWDLQALLYADHHRSLLICLQGMDAAGKDGTIRHVLGAMNPQGCRVVGFKEPSAEELSHDFLWRVHQAAPARGEVVIFNRSHYEDVLIARVHHLVPEKIWAQRYDMINAFEKNLADAGTVIIKFFLNISPDEQLKRFAKRLDQPEKQWKISEADYKERLFWNDYTEAYQTALSRCSTEYAPWHVIPSDHKWFRNLAVGRIVMEHLEELHLTYPSPTVDLAHIRKEYHAAKKRKE